MSNYQVLFNGVVAEGDDRSLVERELAGVLGIPAEKAKRLFNGRTVVLASQLSRDEALDMQSRLEGVGAISRIKDLSPKTDMPLDYEADRQEGTLRDLTAAHIDCPRCGHMQLDSTHCARCGVDLEALFRKRRKEELLMEKKLRDHRAAQQKQAEEAARSAVEGGNEGAAIVAEREPARGPGKAGTNTSAKGGFFSRLFKRSA